MLALGASHVYFNPRPREEGDLGEGKTPLFTNYFNPRPREEGDLLYAGIRR